MNTNWTEYAKIVGKYLLVSLGFSVLFAVLAVLAENIFHSDFETASKNIFSYAFFCMVYAHWFMPKMNALLSESSED